MLYNCDVMFRNDLVECYISGRKISKEDKILIKNLKIEKLVRNNGAYVEHLFN